MAEEMPPQYKDNASYSSDGGRILEEEHLDNICVQTGEEFSPHFLKGRSSKQSSSSSNDKDHHLLKIVDKDKEMAYEELTGILGLGRDSGFGNQVDEAKSTLHSQLRDRKIKLLCSFGGKILPRQSDGKLRYVGGDTRIISIRHDIRFEELMRKTYDLCEQSHTIKYQLPGEDLDALVSVMSDEDLHHMMDEYHAIESDSHRLRMFLVSYNSHEANTVKHVEGNYSYGLPTHGLVQGSLESWSSQTLADQAGVLRNIQKNSPAFCSMTPQYSGMNSNLAPFLDMLQPSASPFFQSPSVSPLVSKQVELSQPGNEHLLDNSGENVCHFDDSFCVSTSSDYNNLHMPATLVDYSQNISISNSSQHGKKEREFGSQAIQRSTSCSEQCLLHMSCATGCDYADAHEGISHAFSDSQLQKNLDRIYDFEGMLGVPRGHKLPMQQQSDDKYLGSTPRDQPLIDFGEVSEKTDEHSSETSPCVNFGAMFDHSTVNTLNDRNAASSGPYCHFSLVDIPSAGKQDFLSQDLEGNTSTCSSRVENPKSSYEMQHIEHDTSNDGLCGNSSRESPARQSLHLSLHASEALLDLPKKDYATESSVGNHDKYHVHQVEKTDAESTNKSQYPKIDNSSISLLKTTVIEDVRDRFPSGMLTSSSFDQNDKKGVTSIHETESCIYSKFPSISLDFCCEFVDNEMDDSITDASMAEIEAGVYGLQIIKNADLEEMEELGSGTYGTVYHGKWRGTDVAIKRIRKSCFTSNSADPDKLTKDFWREAKILSTLHHPNVVAFYGVVPDGPEGTLATVTEFMVNGSLKHALRRKDCSLDRKKRLMIVMDAAFGMEYLHLKNIVHFDLKCDNLLVNLKDPHRPICKVGDFGLSRIKRNTLVSGGVRGTLPWMAPELLMNQCNRVSEKVDVFSFGIAMWELLTGEEPYGDMHCGAIIGGIVNDTLRPPIRECCDSDWRRLMEECWATDPVARPSFTDITKRLRSMATAPRSKNQNIHV